ncbi:MAG: hypothetical protein ACRDP7_26105 [Trebonia sp.]
MPNLTVTHEAPLELIRQHPALAVDLLRAFTGLKVSDKADVRAGPNGLNAVVPAEFTADAVVTVYDEDTGEPQVVIVVEPQGRDRDTKRFAWPSYLANVRSAMKCPTAVLLVICPDPHEADVPGVPTRARHGGPDGRPPCTSGHPRHRRVRRRPQQTRHDYPEESVRRCSADSGGPDDDHRVERRLR